MLSFPNDKGVACKLIRIVSSLCGPDDVSVICFDQSLLRLHGRAGFCELAANQSLQPRAAGKSVVGPVRKVGALPIGVRELPRSTSAVVSTGEIVASITALGPTADTVRSTGRILSTCDSMVSRYRSVSFSSGRRCVVSENVVVSLGGLVAREAGFVQCLVAGFSVLKVSEPPASRRGILF
jgi:hypothetical protein